MNLFGLKVFQEKTIAMNHFFRGLLILLVITSVSCQTEPSNFQIVNSGSLHASQIQLGEELQSMFLPDSLFDDGNVLDIDHPLLRQVESLLILNSGFKQNPSDSVWNLLLNNWNEFRNKLNNSSLNRITESDSVRARELIYYRWAEVNSSLLKGTAKVLFADELERLLNKQEPVVTERFVKSVLFTMREDQIFVNLFIPSSMQYQHTTGGKVKLSQFPSAPENSEIILTCELDDKRFLSVFIRIPEWATNPTVAYGNVKYVAHPGDYCEISRKWRNGDEIRIKLKN